MHSSSSDNADPKVDYLRRGGNLLWSDIELALAHLCEVMEYNHYRPSRIVALARGGLVPATMLAHLLGIQEVDSFHTYSYDPETRAKSGKFHVRLPFIPHDMHPEVNFFRAIGAIAKNWDKQDTLIIDDLLDTGQTMEWIEMYFPEALTATLFWKSPSERQRPKVALNFPGLWISNEQWVTFPWELPQHKGRQANG